MSKRFDARTLTRYLLGSLPTAEAERLDELSVTDEEVAEALRSVENDMIDAYVQGELDEASRAQFKSHYMASAMRRERVAFAQVFQTRAAQGLVSQSATVQAEAPNKARAEAAPSEKGRNIFSARRGLNVSRPAWAWGAALAASVLVAVGGWLILNNARRQQQPAQTETRRNAPEQQAPEAQKESAEQRAAAAQPSDERARNALESSAQEQTQSNRQHLAERQRTAERQRVADQKSSVARAGTIASFILVPQVRGAGATQTVSLPAEADQVVMRLRLEPNESDAYRAALLDEVGAHILWRSGQIKARGSADGKILSINLRVRLLKPQTAYLLRVTNDEGEIVDDYPFRVVK